MKFERKYQKASIQAKLSWDPRTLRIMIAFNFRSRSKLSRPNLLETSINILMISIIIGSYSFTSSFSFSLWPSVPYHIHHYHFIGLSWVCKWFYFLHKAQLIEMYQSILAIVGCFVGIFGFWFQAEFIVDKGNGNDVLVPFDILEFLGSFILCTH